MQPAPFFADVAEGPEGGRAWWVEASDGVKIRVGAWSDPAAKGTVLMFPGRTEYIEKYGRLAADLAAQGYATVTVDWRGQGLADRFAADRLLGHVGKFSDYQLDVRAMVDVAGALGLPRPFHLIGHSMGGSIGLRALIEGLEVESAAFSAPMWGILIAPLLRPLAWAMTGAARPIGLGARYTPGTDIATYVLAADFPDNKLTRDPGMYAYMQRQIRAYPDLALGGPSLTWVNEALHEMRALRAAPLPTLPVYTAVGSNERIVDAQAVWATMARWPGTACELYPGAEHEVLMETPDVRARFVDAVTGLFSGRTTWGSGTTSAAAG